MQTLLYWIGKTVVLGIQALPLDVAARVGRGFGAITHVLDARHRRVARNNLRHSFPEKTEAEIRSIAREHFRRLGENYFSAVKTAAMRPEQILARCEVVGFERWALHEEGAPKNNRIVAIGHFGNFEVYALLNHLLKGYRGATTYRALRQPGLNRLMEELREHSGTMFFERRSGLRELSRALNKRDVVLGILSDQHASAKGVWAHFFGRECSTTPAPALFALRYDSPLSTAICFRTGLARWRLEIGNPISLEENGNPKTPGAIMREVNKIFEAAVRRDPANWFWVHKRWKPRPPNVPLTE